MPLFNYLNYTDVWRCNTPSIVAKANANHVGPDAFQGQSSAEGYRSTAKSLLNRSQEVDPVTWVSDPRGRCRED